MVTTLELTDKLRSYLVTQIESMAKTNPMISFIKPLITRAMDKNFSKITKTLDLISDKDGNIDIDVILSEMMESLISTEPFTFKTKFIGDIEIGGGMIKMNVPLTDKRLVFNQEDLESFREILTSK
jgi:hypothetical protein|nr:MAG TPA: hypothetical protein [Bacteriophage sp.]